jgi:hypothetical protein
VSKSVLFLAVEKLLDHPSCPGYFPAYELIMDDLRDYRFYDDDMLHPSEKAVEYIWKAFSDCYLDGDASDLWREIDKITRAVSHRIGTGSTESIKAFARTILKRIDSVSAKKPSINLSSERRYFLDLMGEIPR